MVKRTRMPRVTLYLPHELREQASKAGLNLSRLLRDAVARELYAEPPGIRTSARRVRKTVELSVVVPVEALRELTDSANVDENGRHGTVR